MKIYELVEKYNKNPRIDIAKEIETQKYISIAVKQNLAQLVLDNCTEIINGKVHIDSVEKYLLFTISVISSHTNLEFTSNVDVDDSDEAKEQIEMDAISGYDALCESGLLIKVIDTFKDDYASCQEVLNMMAADMLQSNETIETKLYQLMDQLQYSLSDGIDKLVDKINLDNPNVDDSKMMEIVKLIKGE